MAKMIITGTCGSSDPTRASMAPHIGKGVREAGYELNLDSGGTEFIAILNTHRLCNV
jgi:hypothetical protein